MFLNLEPPLRWLRLKNLQFFNIIKRLFLYDGIVKDEMGFLMGLYQFYIGHGKGMA